MNEQKSKLAMQITTVEHTDGLTVRAKPVEWSQTTQAWEDPACWGEHANISGLEISTYANLTKIYRYELCYKPYDSLGMARLEGMYKTMQKIQKALQRACEQDGSIQSFGQAVLRISKALGLTLIIRESPRYPGDWQEFTLADGQGMIDYMISGWQYNAQHETAHPALTA